ncbi:MAG: hypothetical protein JNK05_34465 [Myxococcales bacterium]|nr:hypothetical protein [Myxococcales bacterium]
MTPDEMESALAAELRTLAGVAPGTERFVLRAGQHTITITYQQASSGPSTLTIESPYDDATRVRAASAPGPLRATRPLDIVLRHEDDEDRSAKERGINVEWQTGDRMFDDAVYVSAPTHNAHVFESVVNAAVRAAVTKLFALGFRLVHLDDHGSVRAVVTEFWISKPAQNRGRDAVEAFAQLLDALPVVVASGERHEPVPFENTTSLFAWGAGVSGMIYLVAMIAPVFLRADPNENLPGFLAIVVGPWVALALALPALLVAKRLHGARVTSRMIGSSRASTTGRRAGWAAGLFAWFVLATCIHAASLALLVFRR